MDLSYFRCFLPFSFDFILSLSSYSMREHTHTHTHIHTHTREPGSMAPKLDLSHVYISSFKLTACAEFISFFDNLYTLLSHSKMLIRRVAISAYLSSFLVDYYS